MFILLVVVLEDILQITQELVVTVGVVILVEITLVFFQVKIEQVEVQGEVLLLYIL